MTIKEIMEKLREANPTEVATLEAHINSLTSESAGYRTKNAKFREFLGLDDTKDLDEQLKLIKENQEKQAKEKAEEEQKRLEGMSEKDRQFEATQKAFAEMQKKFNEMELEKETARKTARNESLKSSLLTEFDSLKILSDRRSDALNLIINNVKDDGQNFYFEKDGSKIDFKKGVSDFFNDRKYLIQDTQHSGAGGQSSQTQQSTRQNSIPMPFKGDKAQEIALALRGQN